jgi:hypothetical protein
MYLDSEYYCDGIVAIYLPDGTVVRHDVKNGIIQNLPDGTFPQRLHWGRGEGKEQGLRWSFIPAPQRR